MERVVGDQMREEMGGYGNGNRAQIAQDPLGDCKDSTGILDHEVYAVRSGAFGIL